MRLFDIMENFTDKLPPENIRLLVCDNPEHPEDRIFEIAWFYKKGSMLPHEYKAQGSNEVSRLFDYLENEQTAWEPAAETGYYILQYCPKEDRQRYCLSCINPLDSKYKILDPLDDPEA